MKVLIFVNLAIGLLLIAVNVYCYQQKCIAARWIHVAYALVGVFWLVVYLLLLRDQNNPEAIQILVRSGIMVTLAVMTAGSILRLRLK